MNGKSCPKAAPQITNANQDHPQNTTQVLHVSDSLRLLIANSFTADELRNLAAIRDAEAPRSVARRSLDDASVDELAEMLTTGRTPTVGWWRRHSQVAPGHLKVAS